MCSGFDKCAKLVAGRDKNQTLGNMENDNSIKYLNDNSYRYLGYEQN